MEMESGGVMNKIIVGGEMMVKPEDERFPYVPSDYWDVIYHVLDLNTGEVSSLPPTRLDYGTSPTIGAVGSRLYTFIGKPLFEGGNSVSTTNHGGPNATDKLLNCCSSKPKPTGKKGKKKKKNKYQNENENQIQNQSSSWWSYSLDLTKPEKGWKLATPISPARVVFDCFALKPTGILAFGGKIYVFRESEFSSSFMCEVFDPQSNHWRRLKSPPFPLSLCVGGSGGDGDGDGQDRHPLLSYPVLADSKNNRIIACFDDISTLYAYYPSEDRWQCVAEDFTGWSTGSEPVTLADDGVIYIHNPIYKAFFRAYDTVSKQWLNVRLSPALVGVDSPSYLDPNRSYFTLLHRGNGLLCLFSSACPYFAPLDSAQHSFPTSVHVVQLKVKLVEMNDYKEVLVTPFSSQDFHLLPRSNTFLYLPVI